MGLFDSLFSKPNTDQLNSELVQACFFGNGDAVERLLRKGANPNSQKLNPFTGIPLNALSVAIGSGCSATAIRLIVAGADPNSPNDTTGNALGFAAAHNLADVVQALIKRGAQVNVSDKDGWTPLMFAVSTPEVHLTIVSQLLERGADIRATAHDGTTVLMCSAIGGVSEVVRILCALGFDRSARRKSGETAADIARENGYSDAVAILQSFDAVLGKKKVDLYTEAQTALERGDIKHGVGIYRQLAEDGDAEAQCRLAFVCKSGFHDFETAAFWYREAAEQGHAEAQCKLGFLYRSGRGVPKDDAEGARWYQKSASQGYAEAQTNLARCYLKGEGVSRDPAKAVKWFTIAAEAGFPSADYSLGVLFFDGSDVAQDAQKAIYWLNRAADRASPNKQTIGDLVAPPGDELRNDGVNALFNLGQLYRQGKLAPADPSKAFRYYLRAAQLGDGGSQYAVGVSYLNGDGISRDERMGIEYLRKAALQGSQQAQQALVELKQR